MDKAAPDPLQAIRVRIDAVDEAMHRLLIERSGVIAELIHIKGLSKPGAAFRPDREADMMRRLVMRHDGNLPLVTVEHIWREIITTFTAMQAPFGVAAGPAEDPLAMRDLIRFYFGFSVPVANCDSGEAAIRRVAGSAKDIAVVALPGEGRWWGKLSAPAGPQILAKLPFIDIPDRPASLPAYVIGPPLKDRFAPDIRVFSVSADQRLEAAIASHGGQVVGRSDGEILVELPIAAELADIGREAGAAVEGARQLGGFFQPIRFVAERTD